MNVICNQFLFVHFTEYNNILSLNDMEGSLISQKFTPSNKKLCISLAYYLTPSEENSLKLGVRFEDGNELVLKNMEKVNTYHCCTSSLLDLSILLNIMFLALIGRFQLELFILITYFSTIIFINSCVFFPEKTQLLSGTTMEKWVIK